MRGPSSPVWIRRDPTLYPAADQLSTSLCHANCRSRILRAINTLPQSVHADTEDGDHTVNVDEFVER